MHRLFKTALHHLVLGCGLLTASTTVPAADGQPVDLALVLAIDCSFSVDAGEYQLQMQGLAIALRQPEVLEAIQKGNRQRIAILALQWSDDLNQQIILPWTTIATSADIEAAATVLGSAPRNLAEGGTSMSSALVFSALQFDRGPAADRRVIDMATDGRNNVGVPVRLARDRVVGQGITINGLAIRNEWPTLDIYMENQVVGGPSHFVMPADDYEAFGEAMQRKLIKEIMGPGIS